MNAEIISSAAAPVIVTVFSLCLIKSGNISAFTDGAKKGLETALGVFPIMTLLLVSLSMFEASGAADLLSRVFEPICTALGIPAGIVPLIVTRPLSGSAAVAAYSEVLEKFGADSFESFAASVIMGSGETLVYVISVYYSSSKSRRARCVFPIAAFVSLLAVYLGCTAARLFYH